MKVERKNSKWAVLMPKINGLKPLRGLKVARPDDSSEFPKMIKQSIASDF